MTQPTVVPIEVQVDGAQSGAEQLNTLQQAMAAVTIGATTMDRATSTSSYGSRGGMFGNTDVQKAAAYQKEMSGIAATAAVTRQSLGGLSTDVQQLARTLPGGTQQMIATVQATQALGLSSRNQVGQIRALSGEFTRLAGATGTFAPAMAQDFGQLNRELASLDPSRVSRMGDVVTTLQAKVGGSATGMLSFAQSISPVSQQAGLGEASILGIAASFTKLGDDGGAAATAVNKIMSDLNSSVKEGSDNMVAYANATGMTVRQFKDLYQANPAAALEQVTKAIGTGGGKSAYLLQTLGMDSTRTQRALLELSQSGGLADTVRTAVGAYGNGATRTASDAAFNNVDDKLQMLHTTLSQLGDAAGAPVLRPLGALIGMLTTLARPVAAIANSGIGQTALTAAVLGGGGLLAGSHGAFGLMGKLSPLAWGAQLLTSGPLMAAVAGHRAGRYGPEGGALNPALLFGLGGRVNSMMDRGIAGEAMGGRIMGAPNRTMFDLFSGFGAARSRGRDAAALAYDERHGAGMLRRTLGTANTAASLGWQGYWRLFSQPFQQARIPAEDRDWTLTRPGGPGRRLVEGFKEAWSGKEWSTAKDSLREFSGEVRGSGRALGRYTGALGTALRDVSMFAGSGIKATGKGLLGMVSTPAAAGIAAAGAAYVGYQLYKSSSSRDAHFSDGSAQDQMYSTINAFRDSLGLAGLAAVDLSQQLKDAAGNVASSVHSYGRASTVTPADLQAFGLPNSKKVVKRYTGSTAEAAAQISADYTGNMTPQDMQAVKQSLYNQGYAPNQIDAILAQVNTGTSPLSTGQTGALLRHAQRFTGNKYQSAWDSLKRGVGGDRGFLGDWEVIGTKGAPGPRMGDDGRALLDSLTQSIAKSAVVDQKKGSGYAVGHQLQAMNRAMNEALKTGSADLVVGLEEDLTKSLTGKQITGASALDIQRAGGFSKWLQSRGVKVYGKSIGEWESEGFGPDNMTPTEVTALAGQGKSPLAQFYQGHGAVQRAIQASLNQPASLALSTKASEALVDGLQKSGQSLAKIAGLAERNMGISGQQGVQMAGAYNRAQFMQTTAMQGMTSGAALGTDIRSALAVTANGPGQTQQQQQAYQENMSKLQADQQQERSYYQQRLMAQFNFQIQSERAQVDYGIQMGRAQEDYQRQSVRAAQDYGRQRLRAIQDYNIQVKREVLAASTSEFYNPYTRIEAQPVFGAGDLMTNIAEQNQAMQTQEENLRRIRHMGLSNAAVQTLGLSKTDNAQQLAELVNDFSNNPHMIAQMNREITKRTKAAGGLLKDPGDVTYTQQRQDFQRQLHRANQDYTIQQNRLKSDFDLSVRRAAADFNLQMARMAEDVHNQDLQITGDLGTLHQDMIAVLHGQMIDWKSQMTNTISDTLDALSGLDVKIRHRLNGSRRAAQHAAHHAAATGSAGAAEYGGGNVPAGTVSTHWVIGKSGRHYIPGTTGRDRAFIWSELGQESGDYGAVNQDSGALGAYQVLPSNVPSWSKIVLGHSITASQYLHSPRLQDKIAQGMLMRMVAQSGYGGAASEWYSGSASNRNNDTPVYDHGKRYPSIKEYVDSVLARMANAPRYITGTQHPHHHAHHTHHPHHHKHTDLNGTTASASFHVGSPAPGYVSAGDAAVMTSGGRASSITVNHNNQHYEEHYGHHIDELVLKPNNLRELEADLRAIQRRKNLTGIKGAPRRHG